MSYSKYSQHLSLCISENNFDVVYYIVFCFPVF
nr:MAG TPA: hypothetical protein [Caudoviricetes sp.]DAI83239.1 MAG TPA: hypothetical protein [Caudoviricetes sp.]DAI92307.1 MAG TPA: hypothetical protein [Bacteriophage sp.]